MASDSNRPTQYSEDKPELQTGVLKAFVAGVVLANLSKNLLLGFVIGGLGGAYLQQNFSKIPDLKATWRDLRRRWEQSRREN